MILFSEVLISFKLALRDRRCGNGRHHVEVSQFKRVVGGAFRFGMSKLSGRLLENAESIGVNIFQDALLEFLQDFQQFCPFLLNHQVGLDFKVVGFKAVGLGIAAALFDDFVLNTLDPVIGFLEICKPVGFWDTISGPFQHWPDPTSYPATIS